MSRLIRNRAPAAAIAVATFACILAAALLAAAPGGGSNGPAFDSQNSDFDPETVRDFDQFALYGLGEQFAGHQLNAITRRHYAPRLRGELRPPGEVNFVGFKYGDCTPSGDSGCAAPIEVQVWPACERNLSSYSLGPGLGPLPHERFTVRGVPAAQFEMDGRVELYTGAVTVVIFAAPPVARDAAEAVRLENPEGLGTAPIPAGSPLPPPVEGALEGRVEC